MSRRTTKKEAKYEEAKDVSPGDLYCRRTDIKSVRNYHQIYVGLVSRVKLTESVEHSPLVIIFHVAVR